MVGVTKPVRINHVLLVDLELFVAGLAISIFGSIVGLGGGFVLVPLLRLFFGLPPASVAATSLALVVTNNATASVTYLLQRRIRVRTGLLVAAGGIPGSILGASVVRDMPARLFDWLLAALILAVAGNMLLKNRTRAAPLPSAVAVGSDGTSRASTSLASGAGSRASTSVASGGSVGSNAVRTEVRFGWWWTLLLGFAVGLLVGLFGAGGGVLLIAALFYLTEFSPYEVTATAQFSILFISAFGLVAHGLQHDLRTAYTLPLVLGGALGGPLGAGISARLKPKRLISIVAFALILAAIALVARDVIE